MTFATQADFFGLFGLSPAFRLDESALDRAYREIQAQVHPDRYAHLSDTEKRISMQWATRVNEAYRTLRSPLLRACYLLELNGVAPGLETNTAMSPDFLMAQLEWREAIEEARAGEDVTELQSLQRRLGQESRSLVGELALALDKRQAFEEGAELVRRLKFLEKLRHEIDDALEALES
jgi:molecular chaperone HscB